MDMSGAVSCLQALYILYLAPVPRQMATWHAAASARLRALHDNFVHDFASATKRTVDHELDSLYGDHPGSSLALGIQARPLSNCNAGCLEQEMATSLYVVWRFADTSLCRLCCCFFTWNRRPAQHLL